MSYPNDLLEREHAKLTPFLHLYLLHCERVRIIVFLLPSCCVCIPLCTSTIPFYLCCINNTAFEHHPHNAVDDDKRSGNIAPPSVPTLIACFSLPVSCIPSALPFIFENSSCTETVLLLLPLHLVSCVRLPDDPSLHPPSFASTLLHRSHPATMPLRNLLQAHRQSTLPKSNTLVDCLRNGGTNMESLACFMR